MKKLIAVSFLLLSMNLSAMDMPYQLYDRNGNVSKLNLIGTVQDIYVRLGNTVNTYGTQTIAGNKTFTGTVSVPSLTVTNSISTGGKHWELIYSSDTLVATSSFTITGLNGDTDEEYQFVIRLRTSGAGVAVYYMSLNSDSANNYGYANVYGNGASAGAEQSTAAPGLLFGVTNGSNQLSFYVGKLYAKSGYERTMTGTINNRSVGTTVGFPYCSGSIWSNTSANINTISFWSSIASSIGVGSHFEIWAKR